jgi:flagellar hook protein FlgE
MFQQGLSGLNGASKSLDVIGNNISNASTVGFKGSNVDFADLYANTLNGAFGNSAGIGVSVAKIAQQFTQGGLETTNNPLDIAINGNGFLREVVNGNVQYSRNGQLHEDKTNTLVNAQGAVVTGYLADKKGIIQYGPPVPLTLDKSDLTPAQSTTMNFSGNLSSTTAVVSKAPFDANDPATYSAREDGTVYDSLGTAHHMTTYYVKTSANNWDVYASADGKELIAQSVAASIVSDVPTQQALAAYQAAVTSVPPTDQATIDGLANAYAQAAGQAMTTAMTNDGATQAQLDALAAVYDFNTGVGTQSGITPDQINAKLAAAVSVPPVKIGSLVFDQTGNISAAAMALLPTPQTVPFTANLPIFPDTGATQPMAIKVTFNGLNQFGSVTNMGTGIGDGSSAGAWQSYQIDQNGVILGQYSNGTSRAMGQIAMATFASIDGLTPLGNNAWSESPSSGPPIIGVPNAGPFGKLFSGQVENSNVDLTSELVNMITAQRVYQANAQTIKTEDSILQTLVNLR